MATDHADEGDRSVSSESRADKPLKGESMVKEDCNVQHSEAQKRNPTVFKSFSDGMPAVNPLVLEDSATGDTLYKAGEPKNAGIERADSVASDADRDAPDSSGEQKLERPKSTIEMLVQDFPQAEPVAELKKYADNLPEDHPQKEQLTKLAEEQKKELVQMGQRAFVSSDDHAETFSVDEIRAMQEAPGTVERRPDGSMQLNVNAVETEIVETSETSLPGNSGDERVLNATKMMLDQAALRFGDDEMSRIKIAPDDMGSAVSTLLFGPKMIEMMGPEQSRELGNRLLVFGVAPFFGVAEHGQKQLEDPNSVLNKGSANFLTGTGIGMILERLHPVIGFGLFVGTTGAIAIDQVNSPEHKARNTELLNISSSLGDASPTDLVEFCNRSKDLLGPEIYEGTFDIVTGGIGIPEGHALGTGIRAETQHWKMPEVKPDDVLKNMGELSDDAWRALSSLMSDGLHPAYATEYGGRHFLDPRVEQAMKPADDPLAGADNLAMWGGEFFDKAKNWIRNRKSDSTEGFPLEKQIGHIIDESLPPEEQLRQIIDHIVQPLNEVRIHDLPDGHPGKASDEAFAEFLRIREEHHSFGTECLMRIRPETLNSLPLGYKFHFSHPFKLNSEEALRSAEIPGMSEIFKVSLPGFSEISPGKYFSVVPEIYLERPGQWNYTRNMRVTGLDGTEIPIDIAGVIRHEVGQVLSSVHDWANEPFCNEIYLEGRRGLQHRKSEISADVQKLILKEAEPEVIERAILRRDLFDSHIKGSEHGLQQTLADFVAIDNGGSCYSTDFDNELVRRFSTLWDFLAAKGLLRGRR